jgi:hypothetical protein
MKQFCLLLLSLTVAVAGNVQLLAQKIVRPQFEDYPAIVWHGRVVSIDTRSHPLAHMYRTSMRQVADEGVNFAGHYALVSMGCGTSRSITAIIDSSSGRAYFPDELNGWTGIVGEEQRMFRAKIRLLRAVGRPNIGNVTDERHGPSGIYYYDWVNNRLRLVQFTPVGSYPEADP